MKLEIDNWDKMMLSDYLQLQEVFKYEEAVDVEIGIVALLCKVDEEKIMNLPITEYQHLRREAQFISTKPNLDNKQPKYVIINGKRYNVLSEINKWTTAQYIDFQTYFKDVEKYLPQLMSTVLVPEGKIYGDGYELDEVIEDIKSGLPVTTVLSLLGFFQRAFLNSTKGILHYLELKMKKMLRKAKTDTEREKIKQIVENLHQVRSVLNGDGLQQLMR